MDTAKKQRLKSMTLEERYVLHCTFLELQLVYTNVHVYMRKVADNYAFGFGDFNVIDQQVLYTHMYI